MLPTPLTKIPPEFWLDEKRRLLALFLPAMERAAMLGATLGAFKLRGIGITFDPSLVHAAAAAWARQHADVIVGWVGTTNEKVASQIVANWIETPGATFGDLKAQLAPAFADNLSRADVIAVTESTRAFAEGDALTYKEMGMQVMYKPPAHPNCRCWQAVVRVKGANVVVWKTNRDEIVCRTPNNPPWGVEAGCREMHNMVISAGDLAGTKVKP